MKTAALGLKTHQLDNEASAASCVVPFDGKPAISFAIPIAQTLKILLYHVQEVLRIFLANILYSKIVYDKRELDGVRLVRPQSRRCLALCVAVISQVICQEFLRYCPCLWETIHSLLNLTIYQLIWGHNLHRRACLIYSVACICILPSVYSSKNLVCPWS